MVGYDIGFALHRCGGELFADATEVVQFRIGALARGDGAEIEMPQTADAGEREDVALLGRQGGEDGVLRYAEGAEVREQRWEVGDEVERGD